MELVICPAERYDPLGRPGTFRCCDDVEGRHVAKWAVRGLSPLSSMVVTFHCSEHLCDAIRELDPTGPELKRQTEAAHATPIVVPPIDFATPTGDAMVEVRKSFGLSEVGAANPRLRDAL